MYPDLFSKLGYFTERLIVTKEMKFFFKLLEDVLKDRLQSNKVNYGGNQTGLFLTDEKFLRRNRNSTTLLNWLTKQFQNSRKKSMAKRCPCGLVRL
jgi:hypothetical protein